MSDSDRYGMHRRFDRLGRLIGDAAMERLQRAQVMVLGLGGVGSHAAEMLARSGVGRLVLVDFDQVCITNVNRQLHALQGTIGAYKAEVLAERLSLINPRAEIEPVRAFYDRHSSAALLDRRPDYVVDAIDSVTSKVHLLASCLERGQRVVCSTGSGGRLDPTQLRVADLSETHTDPLARIVRKLLRTRYGVTGGPSFDVPAVYSAERLIEPVGLDYDGARGFRCVCPQGIDRPFECEARRRIYGTAGFVTAGFGHTCASLVVRHVVGDFDWPAPAPRAIRVPAERRAVVVLAATPCGEGGCGAGPCGEGDACESQGVAPAESVGAAAPR